jgi:exopolyphosphatase/guanosine-5'-triphosphate,3'-diphosphate pyrophosphatase
MLYSVIDIGSNTVKIAVLDEDHIFTRAPVFFKAVPLNIRSKIQNNMLPDGVSNELALLVKEFAAISGRLTKNPPIAFATASLRGLENANDVLAKIKSISGIEVTIISGETEAYYSFLGAKGGVASNAGISVDLGGGSTELLSYEKEKVLKAVSLPFGCLTLYHAFFEDGKNDFQACRNFVRNHLEKMAPASPGSGILLSGGSAKATLRYKNIIEHKRNFTISAQNFEHIAWHFNHGNEKEKKRIENVLKDRFRLILPAVAVFSEIADFYKKDQVFVCRSGVREGCLAHFLQKNPNFF